MRYKNIFSCVLFALLVFTSVACFSQDEEEPEFKPNNSRRSKLRVGLYVSTMFPSGSTTSFYDGYGYDIYGNRNDFSHSFMNWYINFVYGPYNGQHDQIADALGVNPGEWSFDESDMPTDMHYNISFAFGGHAGLSLDSRNSILFNFTASKIRVAGDFTITLHNTTQGPQQPGYLDVRTFGIIGEEQRYVFQLGWQHIFGEEGGFNFFVEGGAGCTLAEFLENKIAVGYLVMDLGYIYSEHLYEDFKNRNCSGIGFGAWAGCGLSTSNNARTTLQFVYNPSLEVIALGRNQDPSLQHYIGLRIYYNVWRRTVVKESF